MGQKVHPHGLRVGVIKDWDSRWYARSDKVGDLIVEDHKIREFLKKKLYDAGIPKIEIERDSAKVRIFIHCSKPGKVIGKGGQDIEILRVAVEKLIGKSVALSIVEVRTPDANAQLVAENIAQQLEKRIGFRRAMKNAMGRAMRMGVKGIKVMVSGRLGGAEIARSECYHEGTIPLQTIRADIEYGFAEAATTYGRIGVKVWIYKGEVLSQTLRSTPRTMDMNRAGRDNRSRRDNRENRGRDRDGQGGGYNRSGSGGGYNRGGTGASQGGAGGGYRGGQGSQGGSYNRGGQPGQGGQGGYNRGGQGSQGGGYNRGGQPGSTGGYRGGQGAQGGGYNRSAAPAAKPAAPAAPAAPATPTEGGKD
jgi:small subunit ribosomal protein S3